MMDNIEYLIEFQKLIYLSTGINLDNVNRIEPPTPWDAQVEWERLIKARDSADSGAKVDIFPVTNNIACKIENGTETVQNCQDRNKNEKNKESNKIEIRVKRGKGARYVHSGWCESNGDRDYVHKVFEQMN